MTCSRGIEHADLVRLHSEDAAHLDGELEHFALLLHGLLLNEQAALLVGSERRDKVSLVLVDGPLKEQGPLSV